MPKAAHVRLPWPHLPGRPRSALQTAALALTGKEWDSIRPASKSRAEENQVACLWQPGSVSGSEVRVELGAAGGPRGQCQEVTLLWGSMQGRTSVGLGVNPPQT